jgi:ketosteroid isomerase-like protein
MSQENVEVLYRLFEASRCRDKEACVRDSHPDVEIVSYLMGVEGTVYRGHAGMRRYIDDIFSVFPNWHPEVVQATEHGDTLLAKVRLAGRGASSGLEIEQTVWLVSRYRDGKLFWWHGYGSRADALEAVGLRE